MCSKWEQWTEEGMLTACLGSCKEWHQFVATSSDVAHGSNATNFSDATNHFSAEEEERFQKHLEEEYDLFQFDPCYLSWLKTYHPNSLPKDDNRLSTALTMGDMADSPEFFSFVSPCKPCTDSVIELSYSTDLPKVSTTAHTSLSQSTAALTSSSFGL